MRRVKELVRPLLGPGILALDLGCGLGRYTSWMARFCPGGRVVGLDISAESIVRARESNLSGSGVKEQSNLFYQRASWDDLSPLMRPDVVLATEVLEHARRPASLVRRFQGATWVVTVPVERPAPVEGRWDPDGHGHLQSFDEDRARRLFDEVEHFSSDGRYFYLVGK